MKPNKVPTTSQMAEDRKNAWVVPCVSALKSCNAITSSTMKTRNIRHENAKVRKHEMKPTWAKSVHDAFDFQGRPGKIDQQTYFELSRFQIGSKLSQMKISHISRGL